MCGIYDGLNAVVMAEAFNVGGGHRAGETLPIMQRHVLQCALR